MLSSPWDRAIALVLMALALVTRFAMLNYPRHVVFDEYHFGKFVNGYLSGEYFFDIHPPLGKLIIAVTAHLGGYTADQQAWAQIGEPITPAVNLLALRAAPALQGSLLPPLIFGTGRACGLSRPAALLPAFGALLDLCVLVESRLVLTDSSLFLGIVLQLAGSFASDRHAPLSSAWLLWTLTAGMGISIAVCTKWTGMSTVACAGIHSLVALGRARMRGARLSRLAVECVARGGLLLLLPALMYATCSVVHLWLLPLTGSGAKFMKPAFRAMLDGDPNTAASIAALGLQPKGLVARMIELQREMLRANSSIRTKHTWGSRWWEWPAMMRTVLYWAPGQHERPYVQPPAQPSARIYAMGTPFVWWLAAAAPLCFVGWVVVRRFAPRWLPQNMRAVMDVPADHHAAPLARAAPSHDAVMAPTAAPAAAAPAPGASVETNVGGAIGEGPAEPLGAAPPIVTSSILLVGYLANWLPFIAVDRVAFIYHFVPALLHALLLTGVMLDVLVPRTPLLARRIPLSHNHKGPYKLTDLGPESGYLDDSMRWLVCGALVYLMAACFAFFAPLCYGTPMSARELDSRMWLRSWR